MARQSHFFGDSADLSEALGNAETARNVKYVELELRSQPQIPVFRSLSTWELLGVSKG